MEVRRFSNQIFRALSGATASSVNHNIQTVHVFRGEKEKLQQPFSCKLTLKLISGALRFDLIGPSHHE